MINSNDKIYLGSRDMMSKIADKISMKLLVNGTIITLLLMICITTIKLGHNDTLTGKVDTKINANHEGITKSSAKLDGSDEALLVAKSYLRIYLSHGKLYLAIRLLEKTLYHLFRITLLQQLIIQKTILNQKCILELMVK